MNYKVIFYSIPLGILLGMVISAMTLPMFYTDRDYPLALAGGSAGIGILIALIQINA